MVQPGTNVARKGSQKDSNWSKRAGQRVDSSEASPSAEVTVNFAEETDPESEKVLKLLTAKPC